jgi:hypothetical protein
MATVNNVRVSNYGLSLNAVSSLSGNEAFWKLTRAMKKAGWKFKASSNGTTKISNANPAADNWGAGTVSNAGAAAASIAAPIRGRATITGLTGIVAADKGRFLLISGAATGANNNQHQIEEILSATSVRIDARNFAVASDANNGALTWSVLDPLGDVYATFTAALSATVNWWCAQGPSILKIPITAGSIGTFALGENISQTATGATGELLGYTYYNATGWLVVAPRRRGTGTGVYGWDTANLITGAESAATVTQVGTALDYVYEVVFARNSTAGTIQIFVGQFDTVANNAEMFSVIAGSAGATAVVQPGAGGTGNAFPVNAWVMWGNGTGAPGTNASGIAGTTSSLFALNSQYICVDAIPEEDYSADGSWSLFFLTTASVSVSPVGGIMYGFHKLNDTEDGELSPYVTINPGGVKTLYGNARTNASGTLTTDTGKTDVLSFAHFDTFWATTRTFFGGWRGRGVTLYPTNSTLLSDTFVEFEIADLSFLQTSFGHVRLTNVVPRMQSSASPYAKPRGLVQLVYSNGASIRMFKGSFKWMYWVNGDQVTDIYGTDPAWVQLSSNLQGSLVLGPSDGAAWFLSQ